MQSLSVNVVDLSADLNQLTMPALSPDLGEIDLTGSLADAAHAVTDLAGAALPGLLVVAAFTRMVKWAFNSTS